MTYDEYLKKYLKADEENLKKSISESDKIYTKQKEDINNIYNTQMKETEDSFSDSYRENEIQRIINERAVAESMANAGLTDSGMNRTQQTAVQLSYSNNKGKIDRAKQEAISSLSQQLAEKISTINTNQLAARESIRKNYENRASDAALESYKLDVESQQKLAEQRLKQQTELLKQQKENSYILRTNGGLLSYDYQGSLKNNGVDVYQDSDGNYVYVDNNSGKKTTLQPKTNPYTGKIHPDAYNGTFSNGYQPDNISGEKLLKSGKEVQINGRWQNVWMISGDGYYVWDGGKGYYEKLSDDQVNRLGLPKNALPTLPTTKEILNQYLPFSK